MADEKKYIEQEQTLASLQDILNDPNCPIFVAATVDQILSQIPNADVKPVIHGEWESKSTDSVLVWGVCSNCGKIKPVDNYCGHCGADMRILNDKP